MITQWKGMLNCGSIEVICGPMFSGKSEELIRRLRRSLIARKAIQVFTPDSDTRYADRAVVTHAEARMQSEPVGAATEILRKLVGETGVVGIDEANFFGQPLVRVATQIADSGRQLIIAGLDTDYLGCAFPPIPDLLALAECITKLKAVCMCCGSPATRSQRLVPSGELIVPGAAGAYEARCRNCFEPGIATLYSGSSGRKQGQADSG